MTAPLVSAATQQFIMLHRNEDVRTLALKAKCGDDVDIKMALQQIDGWQRARTKLPMWARHDDVIYPPHISMEQCSSEQTARYKAEKVLPDEMDVFIDLTGGFGVDFSYMSRRARKAIYVEQQKHLCEIAEHNFRVLEMANAEVRNADGMDVLRSLPMKKDGTTTVIYLDPARRDTNGRKTYAIQDCTPDIVTLWPTLQQKADLVVVKLSPMLDHHEALRLLPGIKEVHIVSVRNECKELVLSSPSPSEGGGQLICVNDDDVFSTDMLAPQTHLNNTPPFGGLGGALFIPNSSIMKAGCFDALCQRFDLVALDRDSHLFVSKNAHSIENFPGRVFDIIGVCSMNKRELKQVLSGLTHANIAVRNFPISVDVLRKKLKLKDGGDTYIFGTTINGEHRLLVCKKSPLTPKGESY